MKTLLLVALITLSSGAAWGFNHDLSLVKPTMNTNEASGGYYSKYWYNSFDFAYCGATIKNSGNLLATHVFLEMKAYDVFGACLQSWFSDTLSQLNPGETVTFNIPGQITFQPWIANSRIDSLKFIARSDSVDDNPFDDQQEVPFTTFSEYMWTQVARSVTPSDTIEIGQQQGFHPGDFIGFTLKTGEFHQTAYLKFYMVKPWPATLQLTALLYENGKLLDSALVNLPSPQETGWAFCNPFFFSYLSPDSTYYTGIRFNGPEGTTFNIGADTSVYHSFGAESIARKNGVWASLGFVPVMELLCDPEGINENEPDQPLIYPNPANEDIFIQNVGESKVELYNLTGKLLITDAQNTPSRRLHIAGFCSGIYFLKISGSTRFTCKKVVIN